jgi:hypothetical protein
MSLKKFKFSNKSISEYTQNITVPQSRKLTDYLQKNENQEHDSLFD